MNRALLFFFFVFGCFKSLAQSAVVTNDTVYFDRKWQIVAGRNECTFYRIPRVLTDSGYRLNDYFANGRLQMTGYATTPDAFMRTGYSIVYDSLGFKKEEGNFRKGMKSGLWKSYFPASNDIKKAMTFRNDVLEGPYALYDSLTRNLIEEGSTVNGYAEGEWKNYYRRSKSLYFRAYYRRNFADSMVYFYPGGQLMRIDYFKDAKLTNNSRCFDMTGKKIHYYPYTTPAKYKGSYSNLWYRELFYPQVHQGKAIEGFLKVSFTIDEQGTVVDKQIDSAATQENRQLGQSFLDKMKSWKPATIDRHPVAVRITYTVTYGYDQGVKNTYSYLKDVQEIIESF